MISSPKRKSTAIAQVRRTDDGLVLVSQRGILRLQPVSDSIIRVSYTENPEFSDKVSLGINCFDRYSDWEYSETDLRIRLSLPFVTVDVNRKTGSITYYDKDGNCLLREREYESHQLSYYDSFRTVADQNTVVIETQTPDGVKKSIRDAVSVFDRRLCHTTLHLLFQEDEHIFGLGQAPEGTLDLRGSAQYLHQANMKIAIPFFLSTKGYGILAATDGAAIFNDNAYGSYLYTDADREMDFYFIYGPELDDIIRGYRKLTGKVKLLPKWAYGFIQSQERYESSDEILSMEQNFRDRNLGLDCLVLDWNSWVPGHWGEKKLDPEAFPDVPGMIDALEEQGVH